MLFGKHVNKYYLKYGLYILLGCIALFFVDYFQLMIPEIIGDIVDGIKEKTLTIDKLQEFMITFAVIAIVMFLGRFLWRFCFFGNGIRIETDLRNELFYSMQKQSQSFFSENKTGSLMSLYTNDITMVRRIFGMGNIMLFDALFLGVMAIYKMFSLNIIMSVVALGSLTVITVTSYFFGRKITKVTAKNFEAYGKMSEYVQEDLSGIGVVKAFVKEKLQIKNFQKYNQENMDTTLHMTRLSTKINIIISLFLNAVILFIIGFGSYLVFNNTANNPLNFTAGDLTEFIAYYTSLIWPMEAVGRLIELSSQGKASMNRIKNILDNKVEINNGIDVIDNNIIIKGAIKYQNLSFKYPGSDILVLKNISFQINEGEFVGILGETGSGKTTLVDLLLRIYNLEKGQLYIDGIDIMDLPFELVRENIAYVPQDNFLFSSTIASNIAFSDSSINDEKVLDSSKYSDIYKDVSQFPDEFNTILGERGVTVSGGQKQRISIARALYKDAPILILDDSLSAVDTQTEKIIINNLRKLRKGKTTIFIAHRISTLQDLDKIIVLKDNAVSGVGGHDFLLENNEVYAKEVKLQELEKEAHDENN